MNEATTPPIENDQRHSKGTDPRTGGRPTRAPAIIFELFKRTIYINVFVK